LPTPTYTALATVTLGTSASSVTFSSIPATYRDLIFVFSGTAVSTTGLGLRFNSDTGSNYNYVQMYGTGSLTFSNTQSGTSLDIGVIGSGQSDNHLQIMDYSATDKHKTILARVNSESWANIRAAAGRWANTSAINNIQVIGTGANFAAGLTLSLYGVIA
jgi:hypothetical protein